MPDANLLSSVTRHPDVLPLYSWQQIKLRPSGLSLSCLILPREVDIIHGVCLKRGPVSLFLSPFLPASDFKHPIYLYYLQQPTASLPRGPVMTLLTDRKQTASMSAHGVPWFVNSLPYPQTQQKQASAIMDDRCPSNDLQRRCTAGKGWEFSLSAMKNLNSQPHRMKAAVWGHGLSV